MGKIFSSRIDNNRACHNLDYVPRDDGQIQARNNDAGIGEYGSYDGTDGKIRGIKGHNNLKLNGINEGKNKTDRLISIAFAFFFSFLFSVSFALAYPTVNIQAPITQYYILNVTLYNISEYWKTTAGDLDSYEDIPGYTFWYNHTTIANAFTQDWAYSKSVSDGKYRLVLDPVSISNLTVEYCPANQYVTAINGTLICSGFVAENASFANYSSFSNSSYYWYNMNSTNATQMENNGGVLNILESWINSLWCSLAGCTITGDLIVDRNFNVTNKLIVENTTGNIHTADVQTGLQEFSIEYWLYVNTLNDERWIISNSQDYEGTGWDFIMHSGICGANKISYGVGISPCAGSTWACSDALSADTWYYVVGTKNTTNHCIYVDNVEIDCASSGGVEWGNCGYGAPEGVFVGSRKSAGGPLDGSFDEIALYNYSLTTAEIADHWNSGSGKHHTCVEGELGYWQAEDSVEDECGDYNATLNNGATYTNGKVERAFITDGIDDWVGISNDMFEIIIPGYDTSISYNRTIVKGALLIDSSESPRPDCNTSMRGTLWFNQSGTGVEDALYVCVKNSGNTYTWRKPYW